MAILWFYDRCYFWLENDIFGSKMIFWLENENLFFYLSNLNFTDWAVVVIFRIRGNQSHFVDFWATAGTNLVKNVKASLSWQLENDARFFEEVGVDIAWGQFSRDAEMNTDEFSETGRVVVSGCFSVTKSLENYY